MSEITQEQIDQWKERFPVYRVTLGGIIFYYRQILRAEYKNVAKTLGNGGIMGPNPDSNFTFEEQVAQTCVLAPQLGVEQMAGTPAGVVSRLAELIMEASGFEEASQPEQL